MARAGATSCWRLSQGRAGLRTVRGIDAHGRPYHALRPELFLWVHATYLDGVLTLRDLSGSSPAADEREQLYRQWCRIGRCLGLREDDLPPDIDAFTAYFRSTLTTLERTTPVRDLLGPLPLTPPRRVADLPLAGACWRVLERLLVPHLASVTVALLPPEAVTAMGLPPAHRVYRGLARGAARVLNRLPHRLRAMPPLPL
ncbi:oxygenase MpaB family protein [Streptomyces sp. Pv4-95]|uniref:oxygenase MpaB family protein n=1 Tax=Streptomyces sp. Pv4-95 TaxID=3049543 RepID=UPI003891D74B